MFATWPAALPKFVDGGLAKEQTTYQQTIIFCHKHSISITFLLPNASDTTMEFPFVSYKIFT